MLAIKIKEDIQYNERSPGKVVNASGAGTIKKGNRIAAALLVFIDFWRKSILEFETNWQVILYPYRLASLFTG